MNSMLSPARPRFSAGRWATEPLDDVAMQPTDLDQFPSRRPSLRKRALRTLARFLTTFCIGVAATLAWQSFGNAAREMIASSSPWLDWLAPPPAPVVQAAPAASSADQEEIKAIAFGLAGVRQRVDQIAAQLASGQDQMLRDIASKLQATEHDILDRISAPAPSPPPAAAPARKPLTPSSPSLR